MIRNAQFNRERSLIKMPPNLLVTFYFAMLVVTNESIQTNLVTCHLFPVVMTSTPLDMHLTICHNLLKSKFWWCGSVINTTYFLRIFTKLNLILLLTCQWITSKKYWQLWWLNTWACDRVRWYWSPDTLFWQLSIYHNMNVQYQVVPGLPN